MSAATAMGDVAADAIAVAMENLLQCEEKYLETLKMGVDHFAFPMVEEIETRGCKLECDYEEVKYFFSTLIKLQALHTELYTALQQGEAPTVGSVAAVYKGFRDRMEQIYQDVHLTTDEKLAYLARMKANPHFCAFIEQCHDDSHSSNPVRRKTLEEIVMTPLFYLPNVQTHLTTLLGKVLDPVEGEGLAEVVYPDIG